MARRSQSSSLKQRKSKSANNYDYIANLDSKMQGRVRDLEDSFSKGKFTKEIRISFDSIAKSDSKAFGYFISNATSRTVIQFWTEAWKLDQIFKKKIIKGTKYWEISPIPEEKASENMISIDVYENIFVAKGFKTLLTATKSLRLLHLVGIKFSQESWEYLNEGLNNNHSLYKVAINRWPMRPENLHAIVPSLGKHEMIETLDLSANGIEDDWGALIASVIK